MTFCHGPIFALGRRYYINMTSFSLGFALKDVTYATLDRLIFPS